MGNLMNVQQLTELLVQNGYELDHESPNLYTYNFSGVQATWVDFNEGHVGANLINAQGSYEIGTYYDLTNSTDCSDCFNEAMGYKYQIDNPTVTQAIDIQRESNQWFDMLESVAPGRFNVPAVR